MKQGTCTCKCQAFYHLEDASQRRPGYLHLVYDHKLIDTPMQHQNEQMGLMWHYIRLRPGGGGALPY